MYGDLLFFLFFFLEYFQTKLALCIIVFLWLCVTPEGLCLPVQQRGKLSAAPLQPPVAFIQSPQIHLHNCIFHERWSMPDPYCMAPRMRVCVFRKSVWKPALYFSSPFFFLALPHLTVFSFFFSFTCVRCCTIEPQSWCLSFVSDYGVLSPSSTNCSGQRTNGPRFDLLQISTLTCISSSCSWFLLVAPCLSPVNISKEECGCQWLEDDPCSSYQVKWFLISVNGSD